MKKILPYIFLHIIILIYSLSSICSKMAASKEFLSLQWTILYGLVILSLGVYAILWQQILKNVQLNIAYASKAVTLIWNSLWGILIFEETLTITNIIGDIIVVTGVFLIVIGGEKKHE